MATAVPPPRQALAVGELAANLHDNIDSIHACISSLADISHHDAELARLEAEREAGLVELRKKHEADALALQQQREKEALELEEAVQKEEEEIAERRRREDEERRLRREKLEMERKRLKDEQDRQRREIMQSEERRVEDTVEAQMERLEITMETRIEEGRKALRELDERRKTINAQIDTELGRSSLFPRIVFRSRAKTLVDPEGEAPMRVGEKSLDFRPESVVNELKAAGTQGQANVEEAEEVVLGKNKYTSSERITARDLDLHTTKNVKQTSSTVDEEASFSEPQVTETHWPAGMKNLAINTPFSITVQAEGKSQGANAVGTKDVSAAQPIALVNGAGSEAIVITTRDFASPSQQARELTLAPESLQSPTSHTQDAKSASIPEPENTGNQTTYQVPALTSRQVDTKSEPSSQVQLKRASLSLPADQESAVPDRRLSTSSTITTLSDYPPPSGYAMPGTMTSQSISIDSSQSADTSVAERNLEEEKGGSQNKIRPKSVVEDPEDARAREEMRLMNEEFLRAAREEEEEALRKSQNLASTAPEVDQAHKPVDAVPIPGDQAVHEALISEIAKVETPSAEQAEAQDPVRNLDSVMSSEKGLPLVVAAKAVDIAARRESAEDIAAREEIAKLNAEMLRAMAEEQQAQQMPGGFDDEDEKKQHDDTVSKDVSLAENESHESLTDTPTIEEDGARLSAKLDDVHSSEPTEAATIQKAQQPFRRESLEECLAREEAERLYADIQRAKTEDSHKTEHSGEQKDELDTSISDAVAHASLQKAVSEKETAKDENESKPAKDEGQSKTEKSAEDAAAETETERLNAELRKEKEQHQDTSIHAGSQSSMSSDDRNMPSGPASGNPASSAAPETPKEDHQDTGASEDDSFSSAQAFVSAVASQDATPSPQQNKTGYSSRESMADTLAREEIAKLNAEILAAAAAEEEATEHTTAEVVTNGHGEAELDEDGESPLTDQEGTVLEKAADKEGADLDGEVVLSTRDYSGDAHAKEGSSRLNEASLQPTRESASFEMLDPDNGDDRVDPVTSEDIHDKFMHDEADHDQVKHEKTSPDSTTETQDLDNHVASGHDDLPGGSSNLSDEEALSHDFQVGRSVTLPPDDLEYAEAERNITEPDTSHDHEPNSSEIFLASDGLDTGNESESESEEEQSSESPLPEIQDHRDRRTSVEIRELSSGDVSPEMAYHEEFVRVPHPLEEYANNPPLQTLLEDSEEDVSESLTLQVRDKRADSAMSPVELKADLSTLPGLDDVSGTDSRAISEELYSESELANESSTAIGKTAAETSIDSEAGSPILEYVRRAQATPSPTVSEARRRGLNGEMEDDEIDEESPSAHVQMPPFYPPIEPETDMPAVQNLRDADAAQDEHSHTDLEGEASTTTGCLDAEDAREDSSFPVEQAASHDKLSDVSERPVLSITAGKNEATLDRAVNVALPETPAGFRFSQDGSPRVAPSTFTRNLGPVNTTEFENDAQAFEASGPGHGYSSSSSSRQEPPFGDANAKQSPFAGYDQLTDPMARIGMAVTTETDRQPERFVKEYVKDNFHDMMPKDLTRQATDFSESMAGSGRSSPQYPLSPLDEDDEDDEFEFDQGRLLRDDNSATPRPSGNSVTTNQTHVEGANVSEPEAGDDSFNTTLIDTSMQSTDDKDAKKSTSRSSSVPSEEDWVRSRQAIEQTPSPIVKIKSIPAQAFSPVPLVRPHTPVQQRPVEYVGEESPHTVLSPDNLFDDSDEEDESKSADADLRGSVAPLEHAAPAKDGESGVEKEMEMEMEGNKTPPPPPRSAKRNSGVEQYTPSPPPPPPRPRSMSRMLSVRQDTVSPSSRPRSMSRSSGAEQYTPPRPLSIGRGFGSEQHTPSPPPRPLSISRGFGSEQYTPSLPPRPLSIGRSSSVEQHSPSPSLRPLSLSRGSSIEQHTPSPPPRPLSIGQGSGIEQHTPSPPPRPLSIGQGSGIEQHTPSPSLRPLSLSRGSSIEQHTPSPPPRPLSIGQGSGIEQHTPSPPSRPLSSHRNSGIFAGVVDAVKKDIPLIKQMRDDQERMSPAHEALFARVSKLRGSLHGDDLPRRETTLPIPTTLASPFHSPNSSPRKYTPNYFDNNTTNPFSEYNQPGVSNRNSILRGRTPTEDNGQSFDRYAISDDSSTVASSILASPSPKFQGSHAKENQVSTSRPPSDPSHSSFPQGSSQDMKIHVPQDEYDPYNVQAYSSPTVTPTKGLHVSNVHVKQEAASPSSSRPSSAQSTNEVAASPKSVSNEPMIGTAISTDVPDRRSTVTQPMVSARPTSSFFQKTRSLFESATSAAAASPPPPTARPLSGFFSVQRRPPSPTKSSRARANSSSSPKSTKRSSLHLSSAPYDPETDSEQIPRSLDRPGVLPSPAFGMEGRKGGVEGEREKAVDETFYSRDVAQKRAEKKTSWVDGVFGRKGGDANALDTEESQARSREYTPLLEGERAVR